jgi:acyl carrier protein
MSDKELAPLPSLAAGAPEEIGVWLRERIAFYVELPVSEITPDLSLSRAGLDSVYAFALCADIEERLGLPVEPTLLWDLDTPGAVAAYLIEAAR